MANHFLLIKVTKKVKRCLTFFLWPLMPLICTCFLVNCRLVEDTHPNVPAAPHQPKYLSNYWIQAKNFNVEAINSSEHQPFIFFPPLRLDAKGQISENYSLSHSLSEGKIENTQDSRESGHQIYHYQSDFTQSAKRFSGFMDTLATIFDKEATKFYIYKMPENLEQGIMVKYYYRIDDANSATTNNATYRIFLIISIERIWIEGSDLKQDEVWKGQMHLNLSQRIDWMEAVNLGYRKLSQYVLQEVSIKKRANLLNF